MKQLIQRYPVLAFFAIIVALGWAEPIFRFAGGPGNSNMNVHLRWLCCSLTAMTDHLGNSWGSST